MSNAIEVNKNDFNDIVLSSKIPVLVDFWAAWCGPCKMMAPVIDALSAKYQGKLTVCKVNTDENPELASQYQITAIPTLILFKDGKNVAQSMGYKAQDALELMVSKYI